MPMLTTVIEDAFPPLVTRSSSGGGEHDFGESEEERSSSRARGQKMMEVHKNTETTLSSLETTLSSLSVSNKPILTVNDILLSEVIAQWDALSHREKDAAYFSIYGGSLDFVGRRLLEISSFYYAVIDGKNLDRRIVSIALSYLKSFLARQPDESKGFYQLAMLTSLYVAIKIHSSNIYQDGRPMVFIKEVVNWSDGVFTTQDISEMETRMLSTLNYYMNPPVAQHFLDIITPMLDADLIIIPLVKQHIITISNWLCEISATDSYFTSVKPSSVAYAAILVAVDTSSAGALKCFDSLCLKHNEHITLQCYERMVEMYYQLGGSPYENSDRCCSPTEVFLPLGSEN